MLYISALCEDCAVANEIDYEIDDAWTNIHGIHGNGPRDHGVWRLTLTAYTWEILMPNITKTTLILEGRSVLVDKWLPSYVKDNERILTDVTQ